MKPPLRRAARSRAARRRCSLRRAACSALDPTLLLRGDRERGGARGDDRGDLRLRRRGLLRESGRRGDGCGGGLGRVDRRGLRLLGLQRREGEVRLGLLQVRQRAVLRPRHRAHRLELVGELGRRAGREDRGETRRRGPGCRPRGPDRRSAGSSPRCGAWRRRAASAPWRTPPQPGAEQRRRPPRSCAPRRSFAAAALDAASAAGSRAAARSRAAAAFVTALLAAARSSEASATLCVRSVSAVAESYAGHARIAVARASSHTTARRARRSRGTAPGPPPAARARGPAAPRGFPGWL